MSNVDLRITDQRRKLIDGLERLGGKIEASGTGYLSPTDVAEKLGMRVPGSQRTFTAFLNSAEKAGIIKRSVSGRRTKSIRLVYPHKSAKATKAVTPTAEAPKAAKKKRVAKMPDLGQTVAVSMLLQRQDGTLTLALRSDEGVWLVSVDEFVPGEQS